MLLTDRMGYLRAGALANVVVPHPEYVQFCGATCFYRSRLAVFCLLGTRSPESQY